MALIFSGTFVIHHERSTASSAMVHTYPVLYCAGFFVVNEQALGSTPVFTRAQTSRPCQYTGAMIRTYVQRYTGTTQKPDDLQLLVISACE